MSLSSSFGTKSISQVACSSRRGCHIMRRKRGMREKLISFSLLLWKECLNGCTFASSSRGRHATAASASRSSSHPSACAAEHAARCRLVIHEMEGLGHSAPNPLESARGGGEDRGTARRAGNAITGKIRNCRKVHTGQRMD